VTCNAGTACNIACTASSTCQNNPVQARAPNVDVDCIGNNACNKGVVVSGGDASVTCSSNGGCGTTIYCDAGKCAADCVPTGNPQSTLCCPDGSPCTVDATQCNAGSFKVGCP
jgi:hypothetical protein